MDKKQQALAEIRETMASDWGSDSMREGVASALDALCPGWRDVDDTAQESRP